MVRLGRTVPLRSLLAGSLLLACAAATTVSAQAALEQSYPPLAAHPLEWRLHEATDVERERAGLSSLARSEVLALAARHHAREQATLDYLSHTSPVPTNASARHRVANAGGSMVELGENLAQIGRMTDDLPERTVAGWMESPGHRENVLRPSWTHVGFGVHEHHDGRVFVVQVFAGDPHPLVFAHAAPAVSTSLSLRIEITSEAAGFVVVAHGDAAAQQAEVAAGDTTVLTVHGLSATTPTHVRVGWARDRAAAAVGQESGWFDPLTSRLTPDYRNPIASSRVVGYVPSERSARDVTVQLAFERAASGLVVLVDGSRVPLDVMGTHARFTVPGGAGAVPIDVGVPGDGARVRALHRMYLAQRGGQWVVTPIAP